MNANQSIKKNITARLVERRGKGRSEAPERDCVCVCQKLLSKKKSTYGFRHRVEAERRPKEGIPTSDLLPVIISTPFQCISETLACLIDFDRRVSKPTKKYKQKRKSCVSMMRLIFLCVTPCHVVLYTIYMNLADIMYVCVM